MVYRYWVLYHIIRYLTGEEGKRKEEEKVGLQLRCAVQPKRKKEGKERKGKERKYSSNCTV